MNASQWRARGYRTIFLDGRLGFSEPTVLLYRPISGVVLYAPVRSGEWMRHDDVNKEPWYVVPLGINDEHLRRCAEHVRRCADRCYCDQGVETCDFCAGRRLPCERLKMP